VNQQAVSSTAQEQLPTPQMQVPLVSWNHPAALLPVQYGCCWCTWCGTTSKRMRMPFAWAAATSASTSASAAISVSSARDSLGQ
jgi:hypothetical protein